MSKTRGSKRFKAWLIRRGYEYLDRGETIESPPDGVAFAGEFTMTGRDDDEFGSVYYYITPWADGVDGMTIRFSDHSAARGGGYNVVTGDRHGACDLSCDPVTGLGWRDAMKFVQHNGG